MMRDTRRTWIVGAIWVALVWAGSTVALQGAADEARRLCIQLLREPHEQAVTEQLRAAINRIENDADKARFGAVYTLSLLATGHPSAPRLQTHMVHNFPASPFTRLVEAPFVSHICTHCDGMLATETTCTRCTGTGNCTSCRGAGQSRVRGFDGTVYPCMTCQGSGHCPDCNGSRIGYEVCRRCRDGFVPSPLRAEASYHDLLMHIVEGTSFPDVLRAVSARSILEAVDDIAEVATRTRDRAVREDVAARVRERLTTALTGGVLTLQGRIAVARSLDDTRATVRLEGIEQFTQERRGDQHLHIMPWNTIEIEATPSDVAMLRAGETLRLIGPITLIPVQAGQADVADTGTQLATVSIQADASTLLLVGTLVMREGIVGVGDRLLRLAP